MSDYYEIYRKRLNRYGYDYQSRLQAQRARDFENYLLKSVYRVDFTYNDVFHSGTLEPYKQDYTQTQGYLLTKIDLDLPNGAIIDIKDNEGAVAHWMIWWLEHIEGSGYNRYVVLKMTYLLDVKGKKQWGYFAGPGTTAISDALKSTSAYPVYNENNNLHRFITPYNSNITKDMYFEVAHQDTNNGFVVTDVDVFSTPGVEYVSVDPVPLRAGEEEIPPTYPDDKQDYYWLNGGNV